MHRMWFWVRWSSRELRQRWVQVAAIALVIAIGTGVYAALTSTSTWRQVSYDASYQALSAHDLHVTLAEGSYAPGGDLTAALSSMEHPEWVEQAEERLLAPTQIDASTEAETILVPGRVVGVPVSDGGPNVDGIHVTAGRGLSDESGAVLEAHFADQYKLPPEGVILLAGGVPVSYVGKGLSPEYFIVTTSQGDFFGQANFGVVFMPLGAAQEVSGRAGQVNDLVILLEAGVDRNAAAADVKQALAAKLPDLGAEVATIDEDPAYRLLYRDLSNDRGTMIALAVLILLAAAFAAFNLTSRIVEAQRREIGVGMALGVPRRSIALRPLLAGGEIAALGVVFGVIIGLIMGALMRSLFGSLLPLPVWRTPFQVGAYVGAAAIGFLLPFVGTAWPVWRAVRVNPVEAIRTGHLAAKGGGLAPLLKRLRVPGRSLAQMPIRNVLRAPRRTVLTALGIGAAIVSLVAVLGALDSFDAVMNRASKELGRGAPGRTIVTLTGFQPIDSELVRAIEGSPTVGAAEPALAVSATVSNGETNLDIQLQALDLASQIWNPTVNSPADAGDLPGIVLANKAANDLGLKPGDTVVVTHPFRTGESAFGLRQTRMRISGVNPNPMRFMAFTDSSNAGMFGLAGFTNELQVAPASGSSAGSVKRAMFALPGVAVVQEPSAFIDITREQLQNFTGVFRVVEVFALLLALLIAFNAASISADERRRENATMEAYGVRERTLLRVSMVESGVIGVLGTLIGIGLGILALGWLIARSAGTIPELELLVRLGPATMIVTLLLGIGVTAMAPLLNARKLRKMDIPSTLRVME